MKKLVVKTPIGNVVAMPHNDGSDYPGISIQINDNLPVVYLEYDEIEKKFMITTYVCNGETTDDPTHIIKFNLSEDE
ncbi:MAG: hypothetical protein FWH03_05515 [Firmicutes bacterium]|nr:hypothetical protein [Bacillota bacterium]